MFNKQYSLIKINIETGRKNQIRVHMNHLGHPIVFDEKYGYNKNPLKRLGLHASVLEIKNPLDGNILRFEAKVPQSFKALFKKEK
jgi:23S rRNA pseudouridine1911/1915/1917 synthase